MLCESWIGWRLSSAPTEQWGLGEIIQSLALLVLGDRIETVMQEGCWDHPGPWALPSARFLYQLHQLDGQTKAWATPPSSTEHYLPSVHDMEILKCARFSAG